MDEGEPSANTVANGIANGVANGHGMSNGAASTNGISNGAASTNGISNGAASSNGISNGAAGANGYSNGRKQSAPSSSAAAPLATQEPSHPKCPQGHECRLFATEEQAYACDVCSTVFNPAQTQFFLCQECEWKACQKCIAPRREECAQKFLSSNVFKNGQYGELQEIKRLVSRRYVPFFRQWQPEMAILAQNYFITFDRRTGKVRLCICIASITNIRLDTPGQQNSLGPLGASGASLASTGSIGSDAPEVPAQTPISAPTGNGSFSSNLSLPSQRIRVAFVVGSRKRELVFCSENGEEWQQVLRRAQQELGLSGGSLFGHHVPAESVRSWVNRCSAEAAAERTRSRASSACSRSRPAASSSSSHKASANHTDVRLRLEALVLLLGTARKRRLRPALGAIRRAARHRSLRARSLAALVSGIEQPALADAWARWRAACLPHGLAAEDIKEAGDSPDVSEVLLRHKIDSTHERSAEAVAQALVDIWSPLWAPRAALMRRALDPVAKVAKSAGHAHLQQATLAHTYTAPVRSEQEINSFVWCLTLTARRCMRRHMGSAWRAMACGVAQKGLDVALDTLEHRLEVEEEVSLQAYSSTARHHGTRRLVGGLRRVLSWQMGAAFAEMARATMPCRLVDARHGSLAGHMTPSWGTPQATPSATPRSTSGPGLGLTGSSSAVTSSPSPADAGVAEIEALEAPSCAMSPTLHADNLRVEAASCAASPTPPADNLRAEAAICDASPTPPADNLIGEAQIAEAGEEGPLYEGAAEQLLEQQTLAEPVRVDLV